MIIKLITPPATEPVLLSDMEAQMRIPDLSSEANEIELIIKAVREQAEAITRRSFITQTWELVLDRFPSGRGVITIPKAPLQDIVSIKYIDTDGVEQTLSPSTYRALSDAEPADVIPTYGLSWPIALNDLAVVRVRFNCGYGPTEPDTANNVPSGIKQWIMLNTSFFYENRESIIVGNKVSIADLSTQANGLIANYRLPRL